jgi:hypothetical protein
VNLKILDPDGWRSHDSRLAREPKSAQVVKFEGRARFNFRAMPEPRFCVGRAQSRHRAACAARAITVPESSRVCKIRQSGDRALPTRSRSERRGAATAPYHKIRTKLQIKLVSDEVTL